MKQARAALLVVLAVVGSTLVAMGPSSAAAKAKPPAIKHVFVINLENKNYDETFGPDSPAPYLSQDSGGQGPVARAVLRHRPREPRQLHRRDQRSGPEQADAARLLHLHRLREHGHRRPRPGARRRLRVPDVGEDDRRPAHREEAHVEGLHGGHGDARVGTRRSARRTRTSSRAATDMYATRHNPFVYFHSIIDSPSCEKNVVGARPARRRPGVGEDHAELLDDHSEPVQRRSRQHRVPTAAPAGSCRRTRGSRRGCPRSSRRPRSRRTAC